MLFSKLCHSLSLFSSPSSVRGTWTGGQQTATRQMSALMCLWVTWEWGRSGLGMRQLAWRWDGVVWEWGRNDLLLEISSLVDGLSLPVHVYVVQSCLMCVAFHPEQPAIVAGGTFSGESSYLLLFPLLLPFHPQYTLHISHSERLILTKFLGGFSSGEVRVWNTGAEGDPLLASSGFTDLGHKEPVAKVVWAVESMFCILGWEKLVHSVFLLLLFHSPSHFLSFPCLLLLH